MDYIRKEEAIKKAQKLCIQQEKCAHDVLQKIISWKANPIDHEEIIQTLINEKFIDEERYVIAYIKDKLNLNKWGKAKIKYHLLQKQIDIKIIDAELGKIDQKEYAILIKNELIKKINSLENIAYTQLKNKLLQFGSSRGYELELLYPIVEEFKN